MAEGWENRCDWSLRPARGRIDSPCVVRAAVKHNECNATLSSLASRMHKTIEAFLLVLCTCARLAAATACESLRSLKQPDTTFVLARPVAAGSFTPPPLAVPLSGHTLVAAKNLPEFLGSSSRHPRQSARMRPMAFQIGTAMIQR